MNGYDTASEFSIEMLGFYFGKTYDFYYSWVILI